ncbi:MAG: hypothetical protein MUF15_09655 [Acidobacteria bacterium]|jgi:hypothetical protein|nr:hypothetical protein [Acidobacteriota bacterium]
MTSFQKFKMLTPKEATRLDFDRLPDAEKEILFKGLDFRKDGHDIFRFNIMIEFSPNNSGSFRKRRLKDFSRADHLDANIKVLSSDVKILGIYPSTKTTNGNPISIEIKGEAGAKIGWFNGGISATLKKIYSKNKIMIRANHTDEKIQWRFLEPFLRTEEKVEMQFLCGVTKRTNERPFIGCDAAVYEGNRIIGQISKRKIALPLQQ